MSVSKSPLSLVGKLSPSSVIKLCLAGIQNFSSALSSSTLLSSTLAAKKKLKDASSSL